MYVERERERSAALCLLQDVGRALHVVHLRHNTVTALRFKGMFRSPQEGHPRNRNCV